ncbi:sigma-70 family RNA polymerase sigma factor [Aestuariicella hydrocarbonica]|uniref:Sigma-70 family RNA polymerase sigma factor n=1 Tax=Pseudomaricurvus hydrocarbonicus TaxID=1470433 RepID=A0A9E5T2J1_9GAMM|nr:sigma-70 family RNA polymerase sigma factor [Aestuariicella hydrocarbonica]
MPSHKQLWNKLYHQYQSELVRYLQGKWRKQPQDASDIAHQAFERFMAVAEPERIEQPRAYLYQLARNLVVDGLRREQVRSQHAQSELASEEATAVSPLQTALGTEQLQVLQQVIETLPAKRRRAFVLNRVYQMSYKEVAEDMDISVDAVKKHVLRALETCQTHLQHRFEE